MAVQLGWAVAVAAVGAIVSLFGGALALQTFRRLLAVPQHAPQPHRWPEPSPPSPSHPSCPGNVNFAPGACERLEPYLSARLVGQDLALRQAADAICDHLAQPEPQRPLVLSLHGPPGVGKSMFHGLAATALYNRQPRPELRCPGLDCAGYKVRPPACRAPPARQRARRAEMQRGGARPAAPRCRPPAPGTPCPPPRACCPPPTPGAVRNGLHF